MTLLGQFSLWVAFLVGLWCAAIAFAGRRAAMSSALNLIAPASDQPWP